MIEPMLSVIALFSLGYFLMYFVADKIRMKTNTNRTYYFKTDITIYMLAMMFVSAVSVYFLTPNFSDILIFLPFYKVIIPFLCAGLIYGVFLMEMKRFFEISIVLCSVICGFVLIDPSVLMFGNYIPPYLEILCYSLVTALIALGGKVLTGIHGLFSLYALMIETGLILLGFVGGLPLVIVFWAAVCFGIWAVVFQFNMYDENLHLNEGSVVSFMFLFACIFLISVNELSFSSVFILAIYPITELLWAVFCMCFLRNESPDLYMYTAFYQTYLKGVNATVLQNLLLKLLLMNVLFALVQLYAPNIFTFPILTIVFDFWMLSKLHASDSQEISLREAGKKIAEDMKEQINAIKNINKKD